MGENKKKKKGGKVVSHFDPHSIAVGGGNTLFCCLSTANTFEEDNLFSLEPIFPCIQLSVLKLS